MGGMNYDEATALDNMDNVYTVAGNDAASAPASPSTGTSSSAGGRGSCGLLLATAVL